MAAGNGMNMSVGLDLSQLQKDLKVLDKDLNSVTGQDKVVKIRPVIETTKINKATGEIEKCAREGFEPLYKSIKRLEEAQKGLRFSVNGNQFNVSTMKEAQRYLTQLRKEFNALEKNGGMTVDLRRQYTDGISALAEWQKATKEATKQLGQFGFIDYDKEAGKIKALRRKYSNEMKAIRAEMSGLSDTAPRDLARREQLLTRLISLQEKYNSTYKSASSQKRQIVTDLRVERDAIRLKQAEATIQARINSLENDRANAKNLTKKISQIQAERSAVGKLISSYEQLAARQRKLGANSSTAEQRVAMLKQEHIALKNLEAEERARQKAVNQNNALLNDQEKILGKMWTFASRYLNIFMLWNFGKKIIETTGYFQQQQVALEGILGSAAKAEKAIQRIRNMALNSPKTTYELVGYTKQLAAYNVGNQDPDKLLDVVHQLAELSTGLGVDMQRLILAYGQVNAASILRGQELRQFTEAGIPMVQALADKFTQLNGRLVTTGEVFELISKRQVSFEMVASVLRDMTAEGGKFNEMQSRITDTLYGQMQKLKDLWTINLDKLGKSTGGLLGNIASALQGIVKNIRPIANSILTFSILKTAAKWFSAIVILSGSLNRNLAHAQWQMRNFYRQVRAASGAMATMKAIAKGITSGGVVGAAFNAAFLALSAVVGLIVKARQKTKEWHRTLNDINVSFAKDTVSLTSGLDKLIGKLQTLNKNSKEYKDTLDTLKSNYGEYLNDGIVEQLLQEAEAAESTAKSWGTLAEAIKRAVIEKKEYERHETIKNTAIDKIISDIEDRVGNLANRLIQDGITITTDESGTNSYYLSEVGQELKDKNASLTLMSAAREYLSLGAKPEQMPDIIKTWALRNSFTPDAANELMGSSKDLLNYISRAQGYKEYNRESSYLENAFRNALENAFVDARKAIDDNYKVYTGVRGENYNPFGINEFSTKQFVETLQGLISSNYIPKSIQDGLANNKAYQDALKLSDSDQGKTLAIVNAIDEFIRPLKDSDLVTNLKAIVSAFVNNAGTNGTDAARVRTRLSDYYIFSGMNLTDNEKDYLKQFEPTDQTIFDIPKKITEEYQKMEAFIKEHPDKNGTYAGRIAEYERLMSLLKVLAKPEYYNLGDLSKKSGSGRTPREFPEWVNIFKDAYELYKKATTEGGVQKGVAKVLTDKTVQELYGDFFKNPGAVKEFGFKVGNKTVGEIIQENLIEGGLEDGIVDFRKAATATAKEMIAYGKANELTRGHFIKAGEQLLKWVSDTFADDSIKKWLDNFKKSVENLTFSFESMHKNVELARKMSANGTIDHFESVSGVNGVNIYRPQSLEQRENIASLVSAYNNWSGQITGKNGEKLPTFTLGNIGTLKGIEDQIKSLNEQMDMNKEAFKALPQGEIFVKQLITALQSLDKAIREEVGSISGKKFETNLSDTIFNSMVDRNKVVDELIAQLGIDKSHIGKESPEDYEKYIKAIETITKQVYDRFNKESGANPVRMTKSGSVFGLRPYDIAAMQKKYNEATKNINSQSMKGQMDELWYDLKAKMEVFNASIGEGYFKYMQDFLHPEIEAAKQYKELDDERTALEERQMWLEKIPQNERSQGEMRELSDIMARLVAIEERKNSMGFNGINMIPTIRQNAGKNLEDTQQQWSDALNKTKSAAESLMASVKSLISGFSKFYDMLNDGENPAALKDIEGFIEDLQDNFEALIAPITAVMGLIIALTLAITVLGTTAGIVFGALIAAALVIAAIFAIFQMHDRRLERSIEGLKEDVEAFDRAITNLQAAAERSVGFDKLRKNISATGKELEKATAYAEMARLEEEKKNTDESKVKEYKQSYQEAMDSFLNGLRDVRDELMSSTEDWANQMGSAIRSAFQNGENAARAFRDTVKTMIGDVIENMLEMAILQPLIESALENWTNSDYLRQKYTKEWTEKDENGKIIKRKAIDQDNYLKELLENIGDPDKAEDFYQSMLMIGDTLIDTVNGMPSVLQDFYKHNSELGTLSGGIESVTEDTARRIEALENSQLGEIFAIRTMLQNYLEGSGFGDSMTADLQAAIASIASDTNLIRIATESILSRIDQMRTSNVQPLHVTIV